MIQPKRINKEHLFLTTSAAVCLAFMAFVAFVFPAIEIIAFIPSAKDTFSIKVLGTNAVFGGKLYLDNLVIGQAKFSILSLVAYLLPLASVVVSVIAFNKKSPILNILSAILCFGGALMMMFQLITFNVEVLMLYNFCTKLLIGPKLGAIFSVLAGCFNLGCVKIKNVK